MVKALGKFIVKPLVTITVQAVYSRKYYMDGEIAKPGEYPLQTRTTILDAISKAGGLAGFANAKKIYILRGDKKIPFNYKDVIHGKNLDQNIALETGDHIVVPRGNGCWTDYPYHAEPSISKITWTSFGAMSDGL